MLGLVVAKERPDLEEAKNALIVSNAQMKGELKSIEDKILKLLEECKGSPVDDEELIQTLDASKLKSGEIQVLDILVCVCNCPSLNLSWPGCAGQGESG